MLYKPKRFRYNWSMIKNILIDLDDTILDFKTSEARAVTDTLLHFGFTPTREAVELYSKINDEHWKKLEQGELTREQVLVGRFQVLFDKLGITADSYAARVYYENSIKQCVDFIEGAKDLLESLHEKYSLYLVSNGTAVVQDSRIKIADIGKYFKGIFISQRVGYNKPSPLFFEKVFESIVDFKREETIILGDSISSDIAGGRGVGIKTCLFSNNVENWQFSDFYISKLCDFYDILKELC